MKLISLVYLIWWYTTCIFVSAMQFKSHEMLTVEAQEKYAYATAQCKAKCYSKYVMRKQEKKLPCGKNRECVTCINVCADAILPIQEPECDYFCTHIPQYNASKQACMTSCKSFYNIIDNEKSWGKCPESDKYNPRTNFCRRDWDCKLSYKCCRSKPWGKANKHCSQPVMSNNVGLSNLKISATGSKSAKLSWDMANNRKQTQFVIERRFSYDKRVIGDPGWVFMGQTPDLNFQLEWLQKKTQYYFRVGVVDQHGFLGYSKNISFILPRTRMRKPSKPLDFTIREADVSETLLLSWKKPKVLNGELIKYKLVYYKIPDMYSKEIAFEGKKVIAPHKTEIVLDGFMPSTKYQFLLFAVVKIGRQTIRGTRAKKIYETNNFKPLSLRRREIEPRDFQQISWPADPLPVQIKIINGTLNGNLYTFHWTLLDKNVNTLHILWKSRDCLNRSHSGRTLHRKVPSRRLYFTMQKLHEKCRYDLQITPRYYYGIPGDRVNLQLDTYPEIRELDHTSSSTRKHTMQTLFYSLILAICFYLCL